MVRGVAILPSAKHASRRALASLRRAPRVSIYEDTTVTPLPVIDVTRTLLARLCGRVDDAAFNTRVIATTRRLHTAMHGVTAVYIPAAIVALCHRDPAVRVIVSYLCGATGLIGLLYTLASLSWDMIRLLLQSFEFWFLFTVNACNMALWYVMITDERRVALAITGLNYAGSLFADANVYTRPLVTRTMAGGSLCLTAMLVLLVTHRLVDTEYPKYRLMDIEVEAVDLLMTGSFIIAFFSTMRVHRSRHLMFSTDPIQWIPCDMYFPICQLVPQRARSGATPAPFAPSKTSDDRSTPLRLVQNDAARGINVHATLVPAVARVLPHSSRARTMLNVVGSVGLVCTVIAPSLRLEAISSGRTGALVANRYVAIELLGLVATIVFVLIYVAHGQRTLVKRVCLELDAWFVLLQISMITVGTSDVLAWDASHILFLWAIWLWCLWVVFLDAVPPVARRALGFSRRFSLVVTALLLVNPLVLGYWLYLSPARRLLRNREMLRVDVAASHTLRVDVLGFLASKLFTQCVWMGRFFWRELLRPRDAFKLLKRRVVYEAGAMVS